MKSIRFLIAALPLIFLAAGANHQAFGPMQFGMPTAAARTAHQHIKLSYQSHKRDSLTIADVRAQFVSNGSLRVAKSATLEASSPVFFSYKAEPFVREVAVTTKPQRADAYLSMVKPQWEALQDVGDGKFSRKEPKGQFPPIAVLAMDNPNVAKTSWAELVTDTWEADGVKIELVVNMLPPTPLNSGAVPRDYPIYYAMLRATVSQ